MSLPSEIEHEFEHFVAELIELQLHPDSDNIQQDIIETLAQTYKDILSTVGLPEDYEDPGFKFQAVLKDLREFHQKGEDVEFLSKAKLGKDLPFFFENLHDKFPQVEGEKVKNVDPKVNEPEYTPQKAKEKVITEEGARSGLSRQDAQRLWPELAQRFAETVHLHYIQPKTRLLNYIRKYLHPLLKLYSDEVGEVILPEDLVEFVSEDQWKQVVPNKTKAFLQQFKNSGTFYRSTEMRVVEPPKEYKPPEKPKRRRKGRKQKQAAKFVDEIEHRRKMDIITYGVFGGWDDVHIDMQKPEKHKDGPSQQRKINWTMAGVLAFFKHELGVNASFLAMDASFVNALDTFKRNPNSGTYHAMYDIAYPLMYGKATIDNQRTFNTAYQRVLSTVELADMTTWSEWWGPNAVPLGRDISEEDAEEMIRRTEAEIEKFTGREVLKPDPRRRKKKDVEAAVNKPRKRKLEREQTNRTLAKKKRKIDELKGQSKELEGKLNLGVERLQRRRTLGTITRAKFQESKNKLFKEYETHKKWINSAGSALTKDIQTLSAELKQPDEVYEELDDAPQVYLDDAPQRPRVPEVDPDVYDPDVPEEKAGEVDPTLPVHGALRDFFENLVQPKKKVLDLNPQPNVPDVIHLPDPVQPPVPVWAPPAAIDPDYEEREWNRFEDFPHPTAIRELITGNKHKHFFQYNEFLDLIEPKERRIVHHAPVGHPAAEIHQLQPHPLESKEIAEGEPLEKIRGVPANLGEYITLKILPQALHIHIKKGVQDNAIRLLAQRIVEHRADNTTRILLKRTRKGTFSYSQWINSTDMAKLTVQAMYEKLLKITGGRKKSVTIVVRQSIRGGSIHERWDRHRSLL